MSKIYGVDLKTKITPSKVRDAIIECFYQAHQEVLRDMYVIDSEGLKFDKHEERGRDYIQKTIMNYFLKVGGDFSKPTKGSILAVMDELKEFAKSFRSPEIIEKHYGEIMKLLKKLKD